MRLLLISSSTVHGFGYLDHAEPFIRDFLGDRKRVAFIPFAAHDHEGYTATVRERMAAMNLEVVGVDAIGDAEAIFTGGGNTFRLLKTLYERNLIDRVRELVRGGVAYMGSSAGTNIAGPTIRTTNDMPIVWPPTLDALGFVSFQINPHYLDPDRTSKHRGETREERIREFHEEHDTPVVGLREGGMLRIEDRSVRLVGNAAARVFKRGQQPIEIEPDNVLAL